MFVVFTTISSTRANREAAQVTVARGTDKQNTAWRTREHKSALKGGTPAQAATRVEPEDTRPSEKTNTDSFYLGEVLGGVKFTDTKWKAGYPGLEAGEWRVSSGDRVSAWGGEQLLESDGSDGYTAM